MLLHLWTEAHKEFIRQNAGQMKDKDVAAALSRVTGRHITLHAIRHARQRLGIRKRMGRGYCEVSVSPPLDPEEKSSTS